MQVVCQDQFNSGRNMSTKRLCIRRISFMSSLVSSQKLEIMYIIKKKKKARLALNSVVRAYCTHNHVHACMHTYIFDMDRQSYFLPHRSIIVFQFLSCLASADPCFNSVRSEIYRPLQCACTSCHVPVLLYILFQRYFAVMFCDLFH